MATLIAKEIHEKLGEEIPYKWRVQSFSKNKPTATCVAYINSRDVQERLDKVVGCNNWQDAYKEVKGNLYAGIGIKIDGEWIWKWDCGTESNQDAEKGEASDSFKRAAVKWNIGRFLYDLEVKYVKANEVKTNSNHPFPVDDQGKRIWDLTKHFSTHSKPEERKRIKEGSTAWIRAINHLAAGKDIAVIESTFILTDTQKDKLIDLAMAQTA